MAERAPIRMRIWCGVIAAGCLAVLITAAMLEPSGRGHGTHESLGMQPCPWPVLFDRPCPTCGMTTSFAHAAEGEYLAAFRTQPMGAALSLVAAASFWLCLQAAVFGTRLVGLARGMLLGRAGWIWALGLVAAWVYKLITW